MLKQSQGKKWLVNIVFVIKRKKKFRKKVKLWRLKKSEVKLMFAEKVNTRWDGNDNYDCLQRKLLDLAREVCGCNKGKPRHSETWWWRRDVDVAKSRKRNLFWIWGHDQNEEDRKAYHKVKKDTKRIVSMTADRETQD